MKENKLTPRQWKLYEFLKLQEEEMTQEVFLQNYELWLLKNNEQNKYSYDYFYEFREEKPYVNMTSGREMRKDIEVLRNNDLIQKVILKTKIAETEEEAIEYLKKKRIRALKVLKAYWKDVKRLEKHHQKRLVFNHERDTIEALLENVAE